MAHIGYRDGPKGRSWYHKVYLGLHPVTREKKWDFKRGFRTKREAQREARQIEVKRDRGGIVFVEKMTVKEFFWDWFNYHAGESDGKRKELKRKREKKRKWKSTTIGRNRWAIENEIVPYFGKALLSDLEYEYIEEWVEYLLKNGGQSGDGLSRGSVQLALTTLSSALKDAKTRHLITSNPASGVSVPETQESIKKRTRRIKVDPEMVRKILGVAKETLFYVPLCLALGCGLRRGEIMGLKWVNVNLDEEYIWILDNRTVGDRGVVVDGSPKTLSSIRQVALGKEVARLLRVHKEQQKKDFEALGMPWSEEGHVFVDLDGKPYHPQTFYSNAKKIATEAGYPEFTLRFARHVNASVMMKEASAKVAQENLGHATLAMTTDTYGHALEGQAEGAAQAVEEVLGLE